MFISHSLILAIFFSLFNLAITSAVPSIRTTFKARQDSAPDTDTLWWSTEKPNTVVLDGQRLFLIRERLRNGDRQLESVLNNLLLQADKWMDQGPWSVTTNNVSIPNGNKHDYASQAPYWWPHNWNDSTSFEKCPYVQRDGVLNPESYQYSSKKGRLSMFISSYTLALAWWYTGKPNYRSHAADILNTWFINECTFMTPSLQHSQIIPCANDGSVIGIIDFSQQYTDVLDSVAILSTVYDQYWNKSMEQAFRQWNSDFLIWLTSSEFGMTELNAKNNHGTFARLQIAGIAAYVGDTDLARSMIQGTRDIIDKYITANGSQPLELSRTRSWHYSSFNLVAYTRLADIGSQIGIDLWGYRGPEGQSITKAVEFLIPYATGSEPWPYKELNFLYYAPSDSINAAADHGSVYAKMALQNQTECPPVGDQWSLRPAAEQLDNIIRTDG
nr:hypothetical protein L204_05321 [Cryptococcus depauperatus CBS 7855]